MPSGERIPKKFTDDENFRFGIKSGYYDPDRPNFDKVMTHDYLHESLCQNVHDRAIEYLNNRPENKKDWRNKSYHLRSQSVALQIKKREEERSLEMERLLKNKLDIRDGCRNTFNNTNRTRSWANRTTVKFPKHQKPIIDKMAQTMTGF